MKKTLLPVLLATVWISISEFVRNTFLLHRYWTEKYADLGLVFPEEPINGAVWGIWSLCFAVLIYILSTRFTFIQTMILSWFVAFVMMWLVIGNLSVLPFGILPIAIPLSLLETWVACLIVYRLSSSK